MTQTALPGLAPDLYRLEPLRPSYTKLVRQLENVARTREIPVAELTRTDLTDHAEQVGWSPATLATACRVAHAHGLNIDPASNPRPRARPDHMMLAEVVNTGPDDHPARQRTAALAALCWQHPAPLDRWRRIMFSDITMIGSDAVFDDVRCVNVPAVAVWHATTRKLHATAVDAQIPLLARLDERLWPVGTRAVEADWKRWVGDVSFDRWRAWAIDNGATPVSRGSQRHRHR